MKVERIIIISLAVFVCIQLILRYKLNNTSDELIQAEKDKAARIIDSLDAQNDSLALRVLSLSAKADSLQQEVVKEEAKLRKEKNEHKKKLAELSKLSTDELPGYFSKRYNSK